MPKALVFRTNRRFYLSRLCLGRISAPHGCPRYKCAHLQFNGCAPLPAYPYISPRASASRQILCPQREVVFSSCSCRERIAGSDKFASPRPLGSCASLRSCLLRTLEPATHLPVSIVSLLSFA